MKRPSFRASATAAWASSLLVFLLGFQNCSDVSFERVDDALGKVGAPGGGSSSEPSSPLPEDPLIVVDPLNPMDPMDPLDPMLPSDPMDPPVVELPPDMPPLPPTPPVAQCESGFTRVGEECVQTQFSDCMSFVELETSFIPSLQSTGVCYYKKLLNASEKRDSGSLGEAHAMDVIARGHYGNGPNPYVLGDAQLNLTFFAQRQISLTSSRVGNAAEIAEQRLRIDNFILVEVSDDQSPKRMLARGTADAEPEDGRIKVNGVDVTDFIAYADGGTATVDVINVTSAFAIGRTSQLRVRMLDNGGSARTSDMYIIIH